MSLLAREKLKLTINEFLSSESVCVLATSNSASIPRATPVHYYFDESLMKDASIFIMSDNNTLKLNNIEENPHVSLTICDHNSFNPLDRSFANCKGLQITGTAHLIPEDRANDELKSALRYWKLYYTTGIPASTTLPPMTIIAVKPTKYELMDYSEEGIKSLGVTPFQTLYV